MRVRRNLFCAFALLLALFIGVQDVYAGTTTYIVVRKGDTMSTLFGADYRKVAARNGIKDPNRIRIGQRIAVSKGIASRVGKKSVDGFVRKSVTGDLRWNPGADRLAKYPSRGPEAIMLLTGLGDAEAAILWGQLTGNPGNGRFEVKPDGRLVAVLDDSTKTTLELGNGMMIGGKTAITYSGDLKLGKPLSNNRLSALRTDDGWVLSPKVCDNILSGRIPQKEVVPVPTTVEAVQRQQELSVFADEQSCELEYELITGVGVWKNDAAQGHFYWGEGLISCELGDGYSVGAGFYGYGGSGESGTGYSWDEGGIGPQVGLKRNFLASHHDEFGQEVLYPAGWQLKLRYLPNDYVEGRSDSYHVKQWGQKFGLYGEYWQRVSESALYGVSAEAWWYDAGRFSSSWSGDSPQDRGSQAVSLFAQYRLSDDWQFRPIGRVFHQNWDKVTFLQVIPEFRYDESLMISPWISVPIINGNGAGPTYGLTLRYELWGKLREKNERDGRESVKALGTMADVAAPDSSSESIPEPTVEISEVLEAAVPVSVIPADSSVAASRTEVPDASASDISIFTGQ